MKRTELLQEVRKMRSEEAFESWQRGRLTQEEATRLLGACDRTFRRYLLRYEEQGMEGLIDQRLGQVSHRSAPVDEFFLPNPPAFFVHQILELANILYQEGRRAFGSNRILWNHLRISLRLLIFPGWKTLLRCLLNLANSSNEDKSLARNRPFRIQFPIL